MNINAKYKVSFNFVTFVFDFIIKNPEYILFLTISLLMFSCSFIDLTIIKK